VLQFGLGTLLVVVGICCLAAWWWQHPFKVEKQVGPSWRMVETRRRQGLDDPHLHGPRELYYEQGAKVMEDFWRDGIRHGVYRSWDRSKNEVAVEIEFERGRLVRINGKSVEDFTARSTFSGGGGQRIKEALYSQTPLDYLNAQLGDVVDDLQFRHGILITLDDEDKARESITVSRMGEMPLIAALYLMLEPLELTCVCRFEQLWVTSRNGPLFGDDPTGVEAIGKDADARLGQLVSQTARFDYRSLPLRAVVKDIVDRYHIEIAPVDAGELLDEQVTLFFEGITLRSALGALCYRYKLRCEAEGDRLVLMPAE
jgi:hypothetical protein